MHLIDKGIKILNETFTKKIRSFIANCTTFTALKNLVHPFISEQKLKQNVINTQLPGNHPLLRGCETSLGTCNFLYLLRRPRI